MSAADLNVLERDVEAARARFANDLARLRSPTNHARFKDHLLAEARETKDELLGKGKQAANKVAELERKVDELIGQGKIRPPATTQIQQAVAQLA